MIIFRIRYHTIIFFLIKTNRKKSTEHERNREFIFTGPLLCNDPIMSILKLVFENKLIFDEREPILEFQLPFLEGKYGLLLPVLSIWNQLTILLIIQSIICALLGAFIFEFIVKRRMHLVGLGFILPLSIMLPFALITIFDLRSRILILSCGTSFVIPFFRCLEAMYGVPSPAVKHSLENYTLYCSCIFEILFDHDKKTPLKVTLKEKMENTKHLLICVVLISVLYSVLLPYSFVPFESQNDGLLSHVLEVNHILNNVVSAMVLYLVLCVGFDSYLSGIHLFGLRTVKFMNSPLTHSTSPSDFWGGRWNGVLHSMLKRGIYIPVRKNCIDSKAIGAIATFIASGAYHEYIAAFLFYAPDSANGYPWCHPNCYTPLYGKNMIFFGWCGVILIAQYMVGDFWLFAYVQESLPTPVTTFLLLLTGLPLSHLFVGDWIEGGYFKDFAIALPLVVRLHTQ